MSNDDPLLPELQFAFELRVDTGSTLELGTTNEGILRTVPILGGALRGQNICGRILPWRVDW